MYKLRKILSLIAHGMIYGLKVNSVGGEYIGGGALI